MLLPDEGSPANTVKQVASGMASQNRTVFVTVGTTKFEALIRAVDSTEFAEVLVAKGYTQLLIQKGAGEYVPCKLLAPGKTSGVLPSGLHIEYFNFTPSLAAIIGAASLVISHAGSGSIFETLTAGKPLIVVPNPLLMDNHQAELGEHLAAMGTLVCAAPSELTAALQALDVRKLKPFPAGNATSVVQRINQLVGMTS